MEEFKILSTIKLSKSRFGLNRSTPDLPRCVLVNPMNILIEITRDAKKEIKNDGLSQVCLTLKILLDTDGVDNVIDATMNDRQAAATIINDFDDQIYLSKVKLIVLAERTILGLSVTNLTLSFIMKKIAILNKKYAS
ncbi:hypothetical protein ACJMK2_042511 [Sinanodonta woodiana]|uniref:Uncharacterized protein n=1 Tax=Sinanodonta woodiana TaxID=1069815 RepID=A0ABD3W7M2_SINWO